jgi:flavin-dependent dehydrogenase
MRETCEKWDAIVVGAGPAGATAAGMLARRGWRVLLAEKSRWPREKACGGCLSAGGVRMLREVGLEAALNGARALNRFEVRLGRRKLAMEMPAGAAIGRREFDARMAALCQERGATFVSGVSVRLLAAGDDAAFRCVRIGESEHLARVVLACDGLGGSLLHEEPWARWEIQPEARIGVSATIDGDCDPKSIAMFVGEHGYVGVVAQESGRMHVGAALDPAACHARRGPMKIVAEILESCGEKLPGLANAAFCGAGPLARRRKRIGGHRVLAVGDACGYVEPFTGEGMTWAIGGAIAAVNLLPRHAANWRAELPQAWQMRHEREVMAKQNWCRWLMQIVRRPAVAAACMRIARALPWAPAMIARQIGA